MFRIEPLKKDFLQAKDKVIVCRIPPLQLNFIELIDMDYFLPKETYSVRYYGMECQIVASGIYMYHDLLKSTVEDKFLLLKICNKEFYYLMRKSEQSNYIVQKRKQPKIKLQHEKITG